MEDIPPMYFEVEASTSRQKADVIVTSSHISTTIQSKAGSKVFKEETCFPAAFATIIRHSGRVRLVYMFLPASSAHSGLLVTMLPVSHRLRQVSPQSVIINAIYGRIFVSAFTGVCRRVCCDRSSTPPVNKGHARVRNMLIERRKQFAFVWLVKGSISENKPNKPSSVSPTGFSCVV
uniref:Uncharacterized protein n=1 Tax=Heterorhabditis bacteriophora TaxID=37862 RepID=A0A1I7WK79_HETBA